MTQDRYRFTDGVYVYFVTFTVKDWLPIFINPEATQIIIDSLQYSINERGLRINAYVIMPNHLHMIVFDKNFDNDNLKLTLTNFRKFTGRKLADHIDNNHSDTYSRNIRRISVEDRLRQVWQPGWYAKGLISEDVWIQKMDYIHENPVKNGYVKRPELWRYSSAGYWLNGEIGDIQVVPIELEDE